MLSLTRRVGESIIVFDKDGEKILEIKNAAVRGQQVSLHLEAGPDIRFLRAELAQPTPVVKVEPPKLQGPQRPAAVMAAAHVEADKHYRKHATVLVIAYKDEPGGPYQIDTSSNVSDKDAKTILNWGLEAIKDSKPTLKLDLPPGILTPGEGT